MLTNLFRIAGPWPGWLAISSRPRGGDWLGQELKEWRHAGIDIVVSLLIPDEAADLGLEKERAEAEANGMEFYSFPIVDRSVPESGDDAHQFVAKLDAKLDQGKNVLIHCRQGIGRAGLMAAILLIEQGLGPRDSMERVSASRSVLIPETEEQRQWIESFAGRASAPRFKEFQH